MRSVRAPDPGNVSSALLRLAGGHRLHVTLAPHAASSCRKWSIANRWRNRPSSQGWRHRSYKLLCSIPSVHVLEAVTTAITSLFSRTNEYQRTLFAKDWAFSFGFPSISVYQCLMTSLALYSSTICILLSNRLSPGAALKSPMTTRRQLLPIYLAMVVQKVSVLLVSVIRVMCKHPSDTLFSWFSVLWCDHARSIHYYYMQWRSDMESYQYTSFIRLSGKFSACFTLIYHNFLKSYRIQSK